MKNEKREERLDERSEVEPNRSHPLPTPISSRHVRDGRSPGRGPPHERDERKGMERRDTTEGPA